MRDSVLILEEGRIYDWSEILELGFKQESFIKKRTQGHLTLMDRVVFYEKTYTVGMTFELVRNTKKFRASKNYFELDQVNRLMTIQRIECEIEKVESTLWSWKFDFADSDKIPPLEAKLVELKEELLVMVRDY